MLALRHFKHEEPEAELEPKHPTVKFLLAAWNEGDFSDAEEFVASDCAIHLNGFTYDPDEDIDGPTMARQNVSDWRRIAPDIKMTLLQELRENGSASRSSGWSPVPTRARPSSCRRAVRRWSCKEPRC